jgi:uncharacterized protein (TIGR03437 family)
LLRKTKIYKEELPTMKIDQLQTHTQINRRQTLLVLGGAGASLLIAGKSNDSLARAQTMFDCVLSPEMTEGPYWVDERLNRADIRTDSSSGSVKPGALLTLSITVHSVINTACAVLPNAQVDIWHCDAGGLYSDVGANNTVGQNFLRGYQITDDEGKVTFTTIYPGWYQGRTVHIHMRVRTFSGSQMTGEFVSQLFFDDSVTDQVFAQSPYNTRGARNTRNSNDNIYNGQTRTLLTLTETAAGYEAAINVGVDLEAPAAARPSISEAGVVSAASYAAGIAPQGWVSIFGQNLAASTRAVASSDLVDGYLPTTLGGVSVQINNQAAFLQYVSLTQLNVQAPPDDDLGPVEVTVTNAAGTADPIAANMQTILPAFFVSQNYVAAVRSDGVIVTGVDSAAGGTTPAAKSGDVLQLYGTGFGPTDPEVAPGLVFEGAYPLANEATITMGGLPATVSFHGLVAAGLYQFNVTVPTLADGDHEVKADIAGLSTQQGALLKIQN